MNEKDLKFLENIFKKYYFEHFDLFQSQERTNQREFGYQKFNSGMSRHISLKDSKELRLMLIQNVPSDVYCSNAYYSFPSLPMNEKEWLEADLIFDIDAKDLELPCREKHVIGICSQCNEISQNKHQCSKCSSTKIDKKSLPCQICIDSSKKEVSKLVEILVSDFAISRENIQIFFSGNEGFHVYVFNSQFQNLGSRERSELVDYIMFKGALPEKFGMKKFKPDRNSFPDFSEGGWRGRFSKFAYGSKSNRSKMISGFLSSGYSNFQNTLDEASNQIGVKIDPNVTMDIHRIFRLPGSINSKSGLVKNQCENLEKFQPYTDSCFHSDEPVDIIANCPVEFKLKNKKFGPYNNQKISIPTFAAVYLVCKNLATVA
jgi:DNA primase small subunit